MTRYLMILVMLAFCVRAEATTRKTQLAVEMNNLGIFIHLYKEQEGVFPKTWDELESLAPDLDTTFPGLLPTRRMVLLSPPLELAGSRGGEEIVAMTREPFRPRGWKTVPVLRTTYGYLQEPTYAVIVSIHGDIFLRYLPPELIESTFDENGRPLPEHSGLGPFPHEKDLAGRDVMRWTLFAGIMCWLAWRVIRRLRNRRPA